MIKRSGMIVKKMGMTTLFMANGEACPVTILSLEGCSVLAQRRKENNKISLLVGSGKCKRPNKAMRGQFALMHTEPKAVTKEFIVSEEAVLPLSAVFHADYFSIGEYIDATAVSIGKGFAGAMKRHNFGGLRASHGVSVSHRSHGSTGNRKSPAKVFKGKKMAGHMGCNRVTTQNLKVVETDKERHLIMVKGCVPGHDGAWVHIRDALKKSSMSLDNVKNGWTLATAE